MAKEELTSVFQNYLKNYKSIFQLIQWSKEYPESTIRHIKRKLWTNIYCSYWQNNNKIIEKWIHQHIELYTMTKWDQCNISYKRINKKNYMTISMYAEKAFNKMQHNFIITFTHTHKSHNNLRIIGTFIIWYSMKNPYFF